MNFSNYFKQPSAEVLAQRELEDARRELLSAESAAEYAQQMAAYHAARIARLTAFINRSTTTTTP
jgi:adenine-specific DNA methylase